MIRSLLACLLLLFTAAGALATPHIVALQSERTELLIDVNRRETLKPYSRLTSGDTLDIASGGSVQIVWIDDGHQEHWQGPARLTLGESRSREASGRQPVSTRTLPPAMRAALAQTRSDLRQIRQLGAVSNVRSSKLPESTQTLYRDWRRAAAASDPAPELYLLHEQLRLNDWAGLGDTLRILQALDPNNSELQAASTALAAALTEAPAP